MPIIKPSLEFEQKVWDQGYLRIAGVDEVGRGCWAGPVVAAAAILSPALDITSAPPIRDSKTLSANQRQKALVFISDCPLITTSIGQASVEEINNLGIAEATFLAMQRAIDQVNPDYILIDGFAHPSTSLPQQPIVKGDSLSLSIATASIVAKQFRDQLMTDLASQYPNYYLDQHKGYGTRLHEQAVANHGRSPIHRNFTFKNVQTAN